MEIRLLLHLTNTSIFYLKPDPELSKESCSLFQWNHLHQLFSLPHVWFTLISPGWCPAFQPFSGTHTHTHTHLFAVNHLFSQTHKATVFDAFVFLLLAHIKDNLLWYKKMHSYIRYLFRSLDNNLYTYLDVFRRSSWMPSCPQRWRPAPWDWLLAASSSGRQKVRTHTWTNCQTAGTNQLLPRQQVAVKILSVAPWWMLSLFHTCMQVVLKRFPKALWKTCCKPCNQL